MRPVHLFAGLSARAVRLFLQRPVQGSSHTTFSLIDGLLFAGAARTGLLSVRLALNGLTGIGLGAPLATLGSLLLDLCSSSGRWRVNLIEKRQAAIQARLAAEPAMTSLPPHWRNPSDKPARACKKAPAAGGRPFVLSLFVSPSQPGRPVRPAIPCMAPASVGPFSVRYQCLPNGFYSPAIGRAPTGSIEPLQRNVTCSLTGLWSV